MNLRRLPKAELHLHIEGTLEPAMMLRLAARNGVRTRFKSVEAARRAYRFRGLQSFLDVYYEAAAVLRTERDFEDLAWAYLSKAHRQGVRHAEIFFDPQTHAERGVALAVVLRGLERAAGRARHELGLTSKLIVCFLRHLPAEAAMRTLEEALARHAHLAAVGLDSSERGHPPRKFKAVFARARAAGLRAVAHAGEEGPPEYIWQALDELGVERVDHGVRCLEDDALVRRLAKDRVPLTVCPLSNVRLRVFGDIREHPLPRMLERGLVVTVNSDDPAYFEGYVLENFVALQKAFRLSDGELSLRARNSIEASFLDAKAKARLSAEIPSP